MSVSSAMKKLTENNDTITPAQQRIMAATTLKTVTEHTIEPARNYVFLLAAISEGYQLPPIAISANENHEKVSVTAKEESIEIKLKGDFNAPDMALISGLYTGIGTALTMGEELDTQGRIQATIKWLSEYHSSLTERYRLADALGKRDIMELLATPAVPYLRKNIPSFIDHYLTDDAIVEKWLGGQVPEEGNGDILDREVNDAFLSVLFDSQEMKDYFSFYLALKSQPVNNGQVLNTQSFDFAGAYFLSCLNGL